MLSLHIITCFIISSNNEVIVMLVGRLFRASLKATQNMSG